MRRHTIRTTKLLAIAITAAGATGCASTTSGPPATSARIVAEPPVEVRDKNAPAAVAATPEKPAAAVEAPAVDTAVATDESTTAAVTPPPIPDNPDPALMALAGELASDTANSKPIDAAKFRALCDADGYPLVGNVMRKSAVQYEPSQFCADVRAGKYKTAAHTK